jgi:acyl carrier protein
LRAQTTSGKIARRWNQRAFTALTSPAAAPAGEPSPWTLTGSQANVVHMWLAPAPVVAAAAEAADDEVGEASNEVLLHGDGTAAAPAAAATSATAVTTAAPLPDRAQCLTLTGPALLAALTAEVATLLREPDAASIDTGAPLGDIGLDSLLLTQLAGLLQAEYGFTALEDEWLFAETTSLRWLAAQAAGLRGQAPPPEVVMHARPPPPPPSAAAGATVAPADATIKPSATADAAAPAGAAAASSGGAEGSAAGGGGGGGVVEVGLMTTRRPSARTRQQPSWFQANCPCCMFCW